jgi:hypothetical protein
MLAVAMQEVVLVSLTAIESMKSSFKVTALNDDVVWQALFVQCDATRRLGRCSQVVRQPVISKGE